MDELYLIHTHILPDGKYLHGECKAWHEKLRYRLALWLMKSIKKQPLEIRRTTGGR